ncbi:MAG: tryptophan-rich sensory protein [Candidatus Krumholzibacteriota bacterium]|nr:tryptophan-rich sensory protein [Candidatus Krumholzibacteriota bacterium]
MTNSIRLVICLLAPQIVGITAGIATSAGTREWYPALAKPSFNPPAWVFAPVWTTLYLMMGFAAWLVWRRLPDAPAARAALVLFCAQLALNWAWSFLFFGLRSPLAGLVDILLLLAAIVATTILFFRVSAWAGALMIPYLAWVAFATALNAALWRLNG